MASVLSTLVSLAAAGSLMVSSSLRDAAPHNDVSGNLFLVNRESRISEDYVPQVVEADVPGQVKRMRADAAASLKTMFDDAKTELRITLMSVSGYRSYDKQSVIYQRKLKNAGSKAKADEYVARPGASEHQTGLAMDVGQKGSGTGLAASFGNTKGGKWLRENCWKYGFILRYDKGWEEITGYNYEPWHVRYVGIEMAKAIHDQNVPLETFLLAYRADHLLNLCQ